MTVYEEAPPPEDPPQDLPEEELQKIAEASQKLIGKDRQVQAACVSLLYAQQLYHAGLAALRRRCEELGHRDRTVESHLIASMKEASLKPFSREDLVKKTQGMILPWLAAEIALEREREQRQQREQESRFEEARREESFRLPWLAKDDDWLLTKDRGLLLVGSEESVAEALSDVLARAKAEQMMGRRFVVCHLSATEENVALSKRDRGKLDYLRLPLGQWSGKLTSEKQLGRVLGPRIRYARKHRIDLVLVDDVFRVAPAISSAVAASQHLQANYRVLRRWCRELGAFLVGGALLGDPPDLQESAWEILDTRSELRFVSGAGTNYILESLHERRKKHE